MRPLKGLLFLLFLDFGVAGLCATYTLPHYQPPAYQAYQAPKEPNLVPPPQKRIVIYTSRYCNRCESPEKCKPCGRAKALFKQHGLAYEEHNISESIPARKNYQKLGGGILPIIFINGKRMHGFRKGLFEKTYQEAPEEAQSYKPRKSPWD